MKRPDFDAAQIRRELKARATDLFVTVWGAPARPKASEWRPKGKGQGADPRAMMMTGADLGLWIDHRTGQGGDLLDFVAVHLCGLPGAAADFPRVLAEAAAWLGAPAPGKAPALPARPTPRAADEEAAAALARLDAALVGLRGPGLSYWTRARALDPPPGRLVMSLPAGALPRGAGKIPCAEREAAVVCARDASGLLKAAQRILLLPDGSDRDRKRPKYSLGPVADHPPFFPARADDAAGGLAVLAEGPKRAPLKCSHFNGNPRRRAPCGARRAVRSWPAAALWPGGSGGCLPARGRSWRPKRSPFQFPAETGMGP